MITAVRTAQRDSTQHGFTQRTALFQLPVHQVSNHFGVGLRDEDIAARLQPSRSGSWFSMIPLWTTTMCSETCGMRLLQTVRRVVARVGNPGTTV
jgi:hexokinase